MKNMKKTILGVAILAIVLITMMGSVNAASVTGSTTKVEKGDNKTVSVKVNMEATSAVQFDLTFDNTRFEYAGASAGALGSDVGAVSGNVVKVAAFATNGTSTTKEVTVNFKVKDTAKEGKGTFAVSGLVTENGEAIENTSPIEVSVVEPTVIVPDDNKGEQPGTNGEQKPGTNGGQQTTTTTNSQNADKKVGTNGKVINKLPQTGTPVFIGVAAIITIAGVALVVKKVK